MSRILDLFCRLGSDLSIDKLGANRSFKNLEAADAIYFPFKEYDPYLEPRFILCAGHKAT